MGRIKLWGCGVLSIAVQFGCSASREIEGTKTEQVSATSSIEPGNNASVEPGNNASRSYEHWHKKPKCQPTAEVCDGIDNDCDGLIDESGSWAPYNQGLSGGVVNDIKFDLREPGVVYLASGAHVYRSEDSGASWHTYGPEATTEVKRLAFASNEPAGDVWVASGSGVLKLAKGASGQLGWTEVALGGLPLTALAIHPARPQLQFSGSIGTGILMSDTSGVAWGSSNNGVPYSEIASLTPDPTDAKHVLAGVILLTPQNSESNAGQLLETRDGGSTWQVTLNNVGWGSDIEYCASNPMVAYAAVRTGLAKSTDGGSSWLVFALSGEDVLHLSVAGADCSTLYAQVYPTGVRRSTDGGTTWSSISASGITTERVSGRLAADPNNSERVLIGTTGGVFASSDGARTWSSASGFANLAVTALSVSPAAPNVLWMSSWGSGAWSRRSAEASWSRVDNGEMPRDQVINVSADPKNPARVFIGSSPDLWRTLDGGNTFNSVGLPNGANPTSTAYDPLDSNTLYVTTQVSGIFKSTDGGATFTAINGGLTPWITGAGTFIDVRSLLIDPVTTSTLLAGTNGRGLLRSTDAGASWNPVGGPLAEDYVACLVRDSAHPSQLYACVSGAGVWKSSDAGATWATMNEGLSSLDVGSLALDDVSGVLYAATSAGVFRSTDMGATWKGFDQQCVSTAGARSLAIVGGQGGARRLVAATLQPGLVAHSL